MNPMKAICLLALLVATAFANQPQDNNVSGNLKPSQWLKVSELESIPSIEEITLEQLENMSVQEGAQLIDKLYHLSQINHQLSPSFVPSPSNVPVAFMKQNGEVIKTNLNQLVETAKQQQNFGNQEVTILITGLPMSSPSVEKATRKLVQAYMQRYNGQQKLTNENNQDLDFGGNGRGKQGAATSSEEDYSESWKNQKTTTGNLVIINLGATINNLKRLAMIDVEQTGNMIGKIIVQLTNEADVPLEIIHIVGQGIGAQVAGAAGRQFRRLTGHQLRRITALDPAKMFAKNKHELTGLTRGDADFVDAIHTSAYGLGTPVRVGDVDFYPNGPSTAVPGATNIVEASMRATRYFAETVRPGNERNFPAVGANSLQQYKEKNGYGPIAYMGLATEYDVQGDYVLQVNPKSPFGQSAQAQKQNTYHGVHQSSKNNNYRDEQ